MTKLEEYRLIRQIIEIVNMGWFDWFDTKDAWLQENPDRRISFLDITKSITEGRIYGVEKNPNYQNQHMLYVAANNLMYDVRVEITPNKDGLYMKTIIPHSLNSCVSSHNRKT